MNDAEVRSWRRWLGSLVIVLVIGAIVWAIFVTGGPAEARRQKLDERRVNQLKRIVQAVRSYYSEHDSLPDSLSQLRSVSQVTQEDMVDPVTREPFEYRVLDKSNFEICATFETDASKHDTIPYRFDPGFDAVEKHGRGKQCFAFPAKRPSD